MHALLVLCACSKLLKLTKLFSGAGGAQPLQAPLSVAEEGKNKVQQFQAHLPLITAICNPGLQGRHWQVRAVWAFSGARVACGYGVGC